MYKIFLSAALCTLISIPVLSQDFLGGMAPKEVQQKKEKSVSQKSASPKVNLPDKPNRKDAQGRRQGEWATKYPNGRYRYVATFKDDKPIGKVRRFYDTGKLSVLIEYMSQGVCRVTTYHPDEKVESRGSYKDEKRDGHWQFYNQHAELIRETDYHLGAEHGQSKLYYPDGKLLELSTWVNGVQDGPFFKYFKSGAKEIEASYRAGELNGPYCVYGIDGKPIAKGQYAMGVRVGRWSERYPDEGNLSVNIIYNNHGVVQNRAEVDSVETLRIDYMQRQMGKYLNDPANYMNNPQDYVPFQ